MGIYITRINGLSLRNPSQYRQSMVAEIAHQLGCREMGIYRYPADGEGSESLSSRLDGIIAGINAGDIVICQFPTGNGSKFEWELVDHLKAYRGRIAIFVHDMDALIRKDNGSMLTDTIGLYNQAEVLIVPSYAMRQFLIEHGIRKNIKFVIQEMWDYTVKAPFMKAPEYRKEIHYADSNEFEGLNEWNYEVPLKRYGNPDESFPELSKGGFGLVWYRNKDHCQYMKYGASFSLGRYLAAGLPVIAPAGISNQALIEANHLGVIVNSLDEAAAAVKDMNESRYQEYVQSVKNFAPALREGYYTKKVLVDTLHAFYRKDTDRILTPSTSYRLNACKFNSIIVRESYNGIPALSWSYSGEADGFLICDASGAVIHDTRNIHQHYLLLEGHKTEEYFIIKAYVDTLKGKLVVAEDKSVYRATEQFGKVEVSIVIPAYNAEKHIARSIDTVLAQSFADLEIVVVDDGSTDRTSEIIDWYSEKYANVAAIHQENKGAAEARNTGIAYARGEYIGFLDSEDHKKAILFYLENGNQMRLEKLKHLAQQELNLFGRIHKNADYEKLWAEIDKAF